MASQQQTTQQQIKIAQLEQQLKAADSTFDAKLVTAEQRITDKADEIVRKATVLMQQQDKSIASLQLAIADVQGRRPNDWLLAEADYLVKLAGRKLFLEHDAHNQIITVKHTEKGVRLGESFTFNELFN